MLNPITGFVFGPHVFTKDYTELRVPADHENGVCIRSGEEI